MASLGLLEFFQRHHVDRAHVVELCAHLAVGVFVQGQLLAFDQNNFRISTKIVSADAQFVQAGFSHMGQIRLQFGQQRSDLALALACCVKLKAGRFQLLVDFGDAPAHMVRLMLQLHPRGFGRSFLGA